MTITPFFVLMLVSGIANLILGFLLKKKPPKMNYMWGYRTLSSMKNSKNWHVAQKVFANQLIKTGVVMFLISFLGFSIKSTNSNILIVPLLFYIYIIIFVEFKIKQNQDTD